MRILFSYDLWVVASDAALLAAIVAVIGCFSVYRGRSLIGDVLGHASYPGVVFFFILFRTRNSLILCPGTAASAAVPHALIFWLQGEKKLAPDAVLATVLTGMSGLGMVLKIFIQGNPVFRNVPQSGPRVYIFGSVALMTKRDVWLLLLGALLLVGLLYFFRWPLQCSSFSPGYTASLGIPGRLMGTVMLCLTVAVITFSIRAASVVLISAFLLLSRVAVSQCAKTLFVVLRFVVAMVAYSVLLSCAVSTNTVGISTGPMITVCMGVFTLAAFLFRLGKERG